MSNYYKTKNQMVALLIFGFMVIGSLVSWDHMFSEESVEIPKQETSLPLDVMVETIKKENVRHAVRQVFSQFTIEDLMTCNFIINTDDSLDDEVYIHARLMDANLITVGYFDKYGHFNSMLKKKE